MGLRSTPTLDISQELADTSSTRERFAGPLIEKESSTLDVLGATFALSQTQGAAPAIGRLAERTLADQGEIFQPKELNELYPNMAVPFNKPMGTNRAKLLFEQNNKVRDLQKVINQGDPDNFLLEAGKFVVGMGAGMMDPVGMAIGMATGAGIMKVLGGSMLRGGVASKVLRTGTLTAAQKLEGVAAGKSLSSIATMQAEKSLAARAFEGGLGNLIEDVSVTQPLLREEQADMNTYNDLATSVAAGVLFPVGLGGAKKMFKFLRFGKNADLKTEKAVILAERQMENGQDVNIKPYVDAEMHSELPDLKEELELARASDDAVKVAELEEIVDEIENTPVPDRAKEAELANSESARMARGDEIDDEFARGEIEEFQDYETNFTEDFDDLHSQLDELDDAYFDADELDGINAARKDVVNIQREDEMAKAVSFCVRE